jgi:hypothetical protein
MRSSTDTIALDRPPLGDAVPLAVKEVIPGPAVIVKRTFDPTFLNTVVNHPDVRPWLKGEGELDVSHQTYNPGNFALVTERGGFLLIHHEPGRYEVHSQFLPGNGTHPVRAMIEAQEWMFTRTDCEAIVSVVPWDNERAKGFAQMGGLRKIFTGDTADYVELTLMDWAMRTAALEAHGERFHSFVEAVKRDHAVEWPDHPEDPAHNRAAGASLLMIERGQVAKGVAFYNRWARMAGYSLITLLSDSPPTIDMSENGAQFAIGIGANGMEALLCR